MGERAAGWLEAPTGGESGAGEVGRHLGGVEDVRVVDEGLAALAHARGQLARARHLERLDDGLRSAAMWRDGQRARSTRAVRGGRASEKRAGTQQCASQPARPRRRSVTSRLSWAHRFAAAILAHDPARERGGAVGGGRRQAPKRILATGSRPSPTLPSGQTTIPAKASRMAAGGGPHSVSGLKNSMTCASTGE